MRWKLLLAWLPAGVLAVLLLFGSFARPQALAPVQPVPLQMTAGDSVEITFEHVPDAAAEFFSSDPDVVRLEAVRQEDGRAACRLTAVAEGTAEISCAAGKAASPAYALSVVAPPAPVLTDGAFVASVSGKKYHTKACSFAGRIQPENRVFFQTAEDAQAEGYTPCARCLGE